MYHSERYRKRHFGQAASRPIPLLVSLVGFFPNCGDQGQRESAPYEPENEHHGDYG